VLGFACARAPRGRLRGQVGVVVTGHLAPRWLQQNAHGPRVASRLALTLAFRPLCEPQPPAAGWRRSTPTSSARLAAELRGRAHAPRRSCKKRSRDRRWFTVACGGALSRFLRLPWLRSAAAGSCSSSCLPDPSHRLTRPPAGARSASPSLCSLRSSVSIANWLCQGLGMASSAWTLLQCHAAPRRPLRSCSRPFRE